MPDADEWDECCDLRRMADLLAVADSAGGHPRADYPERDATLLFVAGLCRDVWPLIVDERCRRAVETTELYLTGQIDNDPFADAINAINWPIRGDRPSPESAQDYAAEVARELDVHDFADFATAVPDVRDLAAEAVRRSPRTPKGADYLRPFNGTDLVLCDRLRCLLANPFRPSPSDPGWRSPTVTAIATGILADRNWSRLPVLADALEDAGCDNAELLAHARGPGLHLFGCRVVSACLGCGTA